jgi:hypothetical protein
MRRVTVPFLAFCVTVGMIMTASPAAAIDSTSDECELVFRDILEDFGTMLSNEEIAGDILDQLIANPEQSEGDALPAIHINLGNALSASSSLVEKLLAASPECMRSALNVTPLLAKAGLIDRLIRDQVQPISGADRDLSFATLRNLLGRAIETKKDALLQTLTEFQRRSGLPF